MDTAKKETFSKIVKSYNESDSYKRDAIVYSFAGDRNKNLRQDFLEFITGEKLPKSKCGIRSIKGALANEQ